MNLKDRVAQLTPEQRALLAERLAQHQAAGTKRLALPAAVADAIHRYDPFDLTDLQHAYLIGRSRSFDMGNLASKVYLELTCEQLDIERLRRAWQRLIDRHDVLRLVITEDHRQRVLKRAPAWEPKVIDLTGATDDAALATFARIKREILTDLRPTSVWPLFDVLVTRLDGGRAHVHFGLDLLNFDAGSIAILMDELAQVYRAPEAALDPLALTFRDYLQCEAAIRETEYYKKSEEYWMARVDSFPPPPELPLACKPSEIVDTDLRFTRRTRRLSAHAWARIKRQGMRSGLTPTAVMLTVYSEILGLWSATSRFSVNVPFFNRLPVHPQVATIVGDFTTVELLEVDRSKGGSFRARAQRLHGQLLTDLDHRFMDGVKLLRVLAQKRGDVFVHGVPIVLTSLFDHSYTDSVSTLGAICESSVNQTSQVWVDVAVDEHDGELIVRFETVDQLFPPRVPEEMLAAMFRLLESLAASDDAWEQPDLDVFPPAQAAIRVRMNATDAPCPEVQLHTLFADVARRQPEAVAVVSSRRTLTYGELHRLSTQLGPMLRDAGAQPDQPVAIVMEKGWEQVVAAYAILESGAPYVPIDPAYPPERIRYLIERTGVRLVLTQSWIDAGVQWPDALTRVCVDSVDLSRVDDSPLPLVGTPFSLAYVLYTSGSTGEPKGAMLEHRGVVNRMLDVNQRYGIGPHDRVIALTALQHDLSVYDLFGTMIAGATLVVPDATGTRDPEHWLRLIREHGVTVWNSVPAFMEMLIHHAEDVAIHGAAIPQSPRVIVLAGDFIPVSLPDRIRGLFKNAAVISSGGPTETTIWDICYPIEHVDPTWTSIPYGRPMTNAKYYLLKESLEPCPDWVIGEMYIGGIGLARGYWDDAKKTQSRFLVHPQTGERLYRSGDMGRVRPDGNIEIVGRSDFQVKIRGFRVELGEIESVLGRHEDVRDAVVVAIGDAAANNKRLVAYVVPRETVAPSTVPAGASEGRPVHGLVDHLHDMSGRIAGAVGLLKQAKPGLTQLKNYLAPVAKMEFKTKRLGLRHDTSGLPVVSLGAPGDAARLRALYLERQSYRRYRQTPLPLARLAALLACLYQLPIEELPFPKCRYPSAGSLYPVQPYVFIKKGRVADLEEGGYYYDPSAHALVRFSADVPLTRNDVPPANHEIFDSCAFVLLLIGKIGAIEPLYGELAQQFCALEAGYMSQLLMQESARHEIGLCPSGSILSGRLADMFRLDPDHVMLHALMGGGIEDAQQQVFQALDSELETRALPQSESFEARLHAYLKARVPEYMVPSRFIMLAAMPLSANGKVDRRALPAVDVTNVGSVSAVSPRRDLEQSILKIWQEVLHVDEIGIHDNFFDLGGNSIHVVQVHNKIRANIKSDVTIVAMFGHPTIAGLAAHLTGGATPEPSISRAADRAEARKTMRRRRS
jgi:epothilone synthetase B